eukprot:PITA_21850
MARAHPMLLQINNRRFEHTIELEPGVQAVITTPYRHPKAYKDEIEKAIQELLELGHIRLSSSHFASSVVLTSEEHLQHLEEVLRILEEQQFYAKLSKCEIGLTKMLYLGHIIGADGVKVHEEKIQAIWDWPVPRDVTAMRLLGHLHLLQEVFQGVLTVGSTLDRLDQERGFRID